MRTVRAPDGPHRASAGLFADAVPGAAQTSNSKATPASHLMPGLTPEAAERCGASAGDLGLQARPARRRAARRAALAPGPRRREGAQRRRHSQEAEARHRGATAELER